MAATEDGDTPLHLAAAAGHLGIIEDLLQAGADLECRGKDAYTPLHMAAERGQADAVRSLLERGASPAAVTQFGSTPLQLAVHEGNVGVLEAIIAAAGGQLGLATTVPENQRWHRTRISIELASLCSFSATGVRFGEVHLSSSPVGSTAAGVDAATLSAVGMCVEVLHTAPIDKHLVATLDEWAVLISSGDGATAGRVAVFVQQQLCRIPSRIQLWEMAQQAAAVLGCTPFLELALDIRLLRAFAVWKRLGLTDFMFASETSMMDALLQLPSINPRSRPEAESRRVMSVSEFESLATKLEAKAAWRDSGDSLGVKDRAQCASTLWHLGLSPTLSVEVSGESMVAQGSGVYAMLTLPYNPGALPYTVDEIQAEASSHDQGWSDSPDGQGARQGSSCTWGELRVVLLPPGHGAEAGSGTPPAGNAVMVWDDQGRAFTNRHADFRWQNHPPAVRTAARGSSLVSALNTGPGGSLAGGAQVQLLMCAEGPGGCCYVRRAAIRLVLRPVRHIE
ncbi:hypothetical protein GPECTOR_93g626 [Gonium pectorale]|uniref:Uncharacterized protein n=1 Tax=Gonium pectorale TaxID=33097 RepID=A0A150G0F5_GONPE|nr:hypothetical protein GPECTOR_93g626 [Gonium pectorale]|eukprot:KXZ43356.1 hypothetical protein GPECTOR_93g626 [Gonium pectorale]